MLNEVKIRHFGRFLTTESFVYMLYLMQSWIILSYRQQYHDTVQQCYSTIHSALDDQKLDIYNTHKTTHISDTLGTERIRRFRGRHTRENPS